MVNFRRLRSLTSSTEKHNSHVVDKSQNNEVSNQQLSGIVETSNIAPRVEEQVSGCTGLAKKKARGEEICILFPPPYHKVCGKDASFFKAEVTMCIRQFAPLQVSSWKEIPNEDINTMWLFLKKDKDSNEWPNAVKVWKASRTKSNGTWSVPNGEEIMNKLQEEGEKNKEKISAAPLPLVEHFSLVLKRKSSYARGLGLKGITSKAQENILLQAEIEASKKREKNLEEEVAKFKEIAQAALDKQAAEIKQIFAHLASNQGLQNMLSNASPSTTSSED
nr:ATP synthase subunit-like protein [Ipomoea batatas]